MARALRSWLGCLLFLAAAAAGAQDLGKPLLLVASPDLSGPYGRTALIAVPAGEGKHIGFILNRESQVTLASLYPEHPPSAKVIEHVFFGGPVSTDALFAIVQRNPGRPSLRLFGELFVTASAKQIDAIIEQTPNDARYYAGFVGWQPEELAKEVAAGFWYIGEPQPEDIFRKDTGAMWEDLVRRLGHTPVKGAVTTMLFD